VDPAQKVRLSVGAVGLHPDQGEGRAEQATPAYNSTGLIRLHIVAHSDGEEDQRLKLRVRDALLARTGRDLAQQGRDVEGARRILSRSLKEVVDLATDQVRSQGRDYPVKAELGDFPFPERSYGSLVLPAGRYEALRVVIGEGQGSNWWCVLFPPLCVVDGVAKETPQDKGENPSQGIPVKLKVVELLESTKQRWASLWP